MTPKCGFLALISLLITEECWKKSANGYASRLLKLNSTYSQFIFPVYFSHLNLLLPLYPSSLFITSAQSQANWTPVTCSPPSLSSANQSKVLSIPLPNVFLNHAFSVFNSITLMRVWMISLVSWILISFFAKSSFPLILKLSFETMVQTISPLTSCFQQLLIVQTIIQPPNMACNVFHSVIYAFRFLSCSVPPCTLCVVKDTPEYTAGTFRSPDLCPCYCSYQDGPMVSLLPPLLRYYTIPELCLNILDRIIYSELPKYCNGHSRIGGKKPWYLHQTTWI